MFLALVGRWLSGNLAAVQFLLKLGVVIDAGIDFECHPVPQMIHTPCGHCQPQREGFNDARIMGIRLE